MDHAALFSFHTGASPSMQWSVDFRPHWLVDQEVRTGLQNMGNSCYANSVLQCLAFLPPFGNLCKMGLHGLHGFPCPYAASGGGGGQGGSLCAACLLSRQVEEQLAGSYANRRPLRIMGNLGLFSKAFQKGRQVRPCSRSGWDWEG